MSAIESDNNKERCISCKTSGIIFVAITICAMNAMWPIVITHVIILHFVQCIIVYDDLLRYSLPVQSALLMFADNGSDSIVLSKSDRRFIQESADESAPNIYSLCVCVLMSFSSGIPPSST